MSYGDAYQLNKTKSQLMPLLQSNDTAVSFNTAVSMKGVIHELLDMAVVRDTLPSRRACGAWLAGQEPLTPKWASRPRPVCDDVSTLPPLHIPISAGEPELKAYADLRAMVSSCGETHEFEEHPYNICWLVQIAILYGLRRRKEDENIP